LPSIYFVKKVFSSYKRTPQKIVLDFYVAEFIKLFASAILLVLILKFISVKILPLISGYIAAYLAVWIGGQDRGSSPNLMLASRQKIKQ